MYYTYVLQSINSHTLYYGSSNNPDVRLAEWHNKGKVRYTKGHMPWKLVHKEEFTTRSEAMKREKFFKSGQGREYIKNILKN
jgi:putative endonuclease